MALSLEEGGLSWMRPVKEPRERGGFIAPQAAAPTGDESVWRPGSGFRNTGAFRERAMQGAQMAARGAEMGEPTSFRGGVGAPEPIAVMRGGATTFSPGRFPGRQFVEPEMATPTQAQQAWNRGVRGQAIAEGERRRFTTPEATLETQYGGWRAPGQTIAEVAATKEGAGKAAAGFGAGKYYQAMADVARQGIEKTDLATRKKGAEDFLHEIIPLAGGVREPKKNAIGYDLAWPTDPGAVADINRAHGKFMETGDKAVAMKDFQESRQVRKYEPLFSEENLRTHGISLPPGVRENPEHMRQYMLYMGPRLVAGAGAGPIAAEVNPLYVPNILKRGFQGALSAGAGEVVP